MWARGFEGGSSSDGRLLTWGLGTARLWPKNDVALVANADRIIAHLQPLTIAKQCQYYLLDDAVCELVGGDIYRVDPTANLLAQGRKWLEQGDERAEQALTLAIEQSDEDRRAATMAQVKEIRAAVQPPEVGK